MESLLQQSDRVALADPMAAQPFRVVKNHREIDGTHTIEMRPVDGDGFRFAPGQFTMICAFGIGEVPISISGDPAREGVLEQTIRSVGAVSSALCRLHRDDVVGIRGPYGAPWPVEKAVGNDVMIIGGGIGLAPLRPAIYHILRHRSRYGKISILYGTRQPNDILFRRELEAWRGRFDLEVLVTVDSAGRDWRAPVGPVTTLIPRSAVREGVAMLCGPEIMMRFTVQALLDRGFEAEEIYLSMERNMKCGIGFCGHCQMGPAFVCKDGPVFAYPDIEKLMRIRGI